MDLNGPGTSLFQGNNLNNFDNLAEREEEEEALEEQKRRDLELKNMLENAFDDVSFDNDEGSMYNESQNHSSSGHSSYHNNSHNDLDPNVFKQISQNTLVTDVEKNYGNIKIDTLNSSLKQFSKNSQIKRVDFNNESDNYSDKCRKKIQNGSLHDIVDASGGGDGDVQTSLHYNHCFQRSPLGEIVCNGMLSNSNEKKAQAQFTESAHDSSEQIKILYDVRVREVHRLTELIDSMRNEHEIEIKELKHQLALMLAEKERAAISQSQLQSLLVSSKQEAEELINDLKTLEKAHKELEISKSEIVMELAAAKLTVDDLQRKVLVLEKGSRNKSESMQYETNLKALAEKHNFEIMSLRNELDSYMRKYEIVFKENEELKLKINNVSLINEENLAKKSEIINRLSKQIDETQIQCENLMKSSSSEELLRLQMELKILKEEKSLLALRLENLGKENSKQEEELQQYESLSKISLLTENLSPLKELDSLNTSGKLQAELYRALSGLKTKRQEIKNLQAQLDEKNYKISLMEDNEKIMKNEVAKQKDAANAHLTEIKRQENLVSSKQEEITKLLKVIEELKNNDGGSKRDLELKFEELENENKSLRNQISDLEKEKTEAMINFSEEYMRFHNEGLERFREETEKLHKLEIIKKDLEIENFRKEIEEIKNLYVEVFSTKESLLAQLEKEKDNSGRSSAVDMEEVKKLQKELDKSRNRILELDQTLKQQYQQEVEILNLEINQLNLEIEKIKKEKDREVAEKDKISVENEMLKTEIEQVTSDKNLLFLNNEKVEKELDELRKNIQKLRNTSEKQMKELAEKHEIELQSLTSDYEITIKKLKKELELTLAKTVNCESKYTSPIKFGLEGSKSPSTQGCFLYADKATSPVQTICTLESSTSPLSDGRKSKRKSGLRESLSLREISIITDPEPVKIPKKEVIELMEKLGAHHEEEMKAMESKYRTELVKLDRKFQVEIDKAKEIIRRELQKEHVTEIEQLEEKHRIEMENRIEEEKKEAVVDLITEWACEVQSLKVSYAEAQAEMERMKMKYKAAKSVALQYKTYFKSKTELMKEEWKRVEDGYEKALKELEKNVHMLVDVKEDEVKEKVESITKIYEQKINKMKEKLSKCEGKLKAEKLGGSQKQVEACSSQDKFDFRKEMERLSIPEGRLCQNSLKKKAASELFSRLEELREIEIETGEIFSPLKKDSGSIRKLGAQKTKGSKERLTAKEDFSDKERTSR